MTLDEIIRMAIDAGLYSGNARTPGTEAMIVKRLQRFTALVAAAEREACAKVCEDYALDRWNLYKGRAPYTGSEEGRAAPEAQGEGIAAETLADKIRARGEKGQS